MKLNVYNTEFALKVPQESLIFLTYLETVCNYGIIFAAFIFDIVSVTFPILRQIAKG